MDNQPLLSLARHLFSYQGQIEAWFREQWVHYKAPFYCSVDLRNDGIKVAPVDTNLFPAGFNNLNPDCRAFCAQAIKATIAEMGQNVTQVLLIPENHSRNRPYFENVAFLQSLLQEAGLTVRMGTWMKDVVKPQRIELSDGRFLTYEPIVREHDRLRVGDFVADLIILNNDLSEGVPDILQGLLQPVVPSCNLGWDKRSKYRYFQHYERVVAEFVKAIPCDSWLMSAYFDRCVSVHFLKKEGLDCVVRHVDDLMKKIQRKYVQYGIQASPYVIVKADHGTYGMAVMSVKDSETLLQLNRRARTHMTTTKGSRPVDCVLLQEGVYTSDTHEAMVLEPVIVLFGHQVVGGFYRAHASRSRDENLNAPGMQFLPLSLHDDKNKDEIFYVYTVVARLAALAAAMEIAEDAL